MLPDGSGVELARRLREWTSMPILVLSAVGEEDAKVEALEAGADDYVTKPFGPRELVARLGAALRRVGDAPGEPAIEVDGLHVDLNARVVRRDGEEIHLTPIEFDLLRALVRHRGRLMTHRSLLVEVWGPQYGDDTQVLRAHIANLRRKIEPPGERALHPHRCGRRLPLRLLARRSSQDLYELIALLDSAFRRRSQDESMDLIAIALALGVFAVLVLLIEGIERV